LASMTEKKSVSGASADLHMVTKKKVADPVGTQIPDVHPASLLIERYHNLDSSLSAVAVCNVMCNVGFILFIIYLTMHSVTQTMLCR
jgi:hypothetical protein